jgi:adenylosuccinate synthase
MDLLDPVIFSRKLRENLEEKNAILERLGVEPLEYNAIYRTYQDHAEILKKYMADTALALDKSLKAGKKLLFEGAQGTLLDVDHGTYPFVTSSSTCAGGAATGTGVSPRAINEVIGISKAYVTRVGSGPFPTELLDETGEKLRQVGGEFGATTGRPRRCGWFDAMVIRYSVRVNGLTGIALTKLDVLSGFDTIKVCTGYRYEGVMLETLPAKLEVFENCEPVYEELPGWQTDICDVRSFEELPANAQAYVKRLEELAGCPIVMVSVGPRRDQTMQLKNPFAA